VASSTVESNDYSGSSLDPLAVTFTPFAGGYGVNVTGGATGF
jgi:hypothetical protein